MNIDWNQLEDFLRHQRQVGSTTVAMEAAKENGAMLIAHNQEYARQIGGVSQSELSRHRGLKQPVLFDNGLLIKMCEDFDQIRGSEAELRKENGDLRRDMSRFEDRARKEANYALENDWKAVYAEKMAIRQSIPNAIQMGKLLALPILTERVPINEMRYYMLKGFPSQGR